MTSSEEGSHLEIATRGKLELPQAELTMTRRNQYDRCIKRIREAPEPSTGFLAAAWAFVGIAASAGLGALALPSAGELKAGVAAVFVVILVASSIAALVAFLAHYKMKESRKDQRNDIADEMSLIDLSR